jgi:hypothetical protein
MDLGILNTVIAMVVVLLVLSLLVQSVQTLVKKLLKLKSKQIEDSLKDLFDQAIAGATPPAQQAPNANSPAPAQPAADGLFGRIRNFVRLIIIGRSDSASAGAEDFTNKVLDEFKKIGRVTKFGKPVLDSLSKEDLFKVMAKFESEKFFPNYVEKFQVVCNQILALRNAVEAVFSNEALQGAASARLAEIRAIMAPIFNNVDAILDGQQVKPKVLFADLLRLRQLDISGVLKLLDEAQQAITQERGVATQAGNNVEVEQLDAISKALAEMAKLIGELSEKFDEAVSPLRKKLEQVEVWFDTVTQSFDERYARHMKAVAIYISIVVVILLNANFFQIYRSLSTNEVQRNLITDAAPGILENARKAQPTPSTSPGATPANATASPTPAVKEQIEQSRQAMEALVNTYESFGFSPLTGQQFEAFVWSTGGWTGFKKDRLGNRAWGGFRPVRNEKGLINDDNIPIPPNCQGKDKDGKFIMKCTPAWRAQSGAEWWESRKADITTLFGWAIMVMLLSVGAPFWQDTLESLFGIKKLLRAKTGTQNIETPSGAGQPKE